MRKLENGFSIPINSGYYIPHATFSYFVSLITKDYSVMGKLSDFISVKAFLFHNDEKRFLQLYRKYTPMLYPFLLRSLNFNNYITEEIVQETWVRVVQNLNRFKWNSSFKTWLFGIAINVKKEFLRERDKTTDNFTGSDSELGRQNMNENIDLENAMSSLPEGYKNIFMLHDVHGFKHREISAMLGIKVGTSRSQLSHARAALRKFLMEKN